MPLHSDPAVLALGLKTHDEVAEMHALGRIIHPDEIANLALFLASDESSAITGSRTYRAPIVPSAPFETLAPPGAPASRFRAWL